MNREDPTPDDFDEEPLGTEEVEFYDRPAMKRDAAEPAPEKALEPKAPREKARVLPFPKKAD